MVTRVRLRTIMSKIKKWMTDHNLVRGPAHFDRAIQNDTMPSRPDFAFSLYYDDNAFKYLFDKKYGGGSVHLLNDFDDEVLKPLKLHMERFGPIEIGLFQGRKLPRSR